MVTWVLRNVAVDVRWRRYIVLIDLPVTVSLRASSAEERKCLRHLDCGSCFWRRSASILLKLAPKVRRTNQFYITTLLHYLLCLLHKKYITINSCFVMTILTLGVCFGNLLQVVYSCCRSFLLIFAHVVPVSIWVQLPSFNVFSFGHHLPTFSHLIFCLLFSDSVVFCFVILQCAVVCL